MILPLFFMHYQVKLLTSPNVLLVYDQVSVKNNDIPYNTNMLY